VATQPPPPKRGSKPPPQPAPAPQQSQPPPASGSGGSGPPNVIGLTLSQAIAALQGAGWIVNSVVSARNPTQGVNQQTYAQTPVVSAVPHSSGQSGQYYGHSVSLAVQ
jgi:hypothetical protein